MHTHYRPICRSCKIDYATHRVVRLKGARREARWSLRPNLCRECAVAAASAINAISRRSGDLR